MSNKRSYRRSSVNKILADSLGEITLGFGGAEPQKVPRN